MPAKPATTRKNKPPKQLVKKPAKPKTATKSVKKTAKTTKKTKTGRPRPHLRNQDKLRWAAQLGYRDVVEELLAKGHDPNDAQSGSTPLAMACFHRNVAIVRVLLAAGADPNFATETDSAPLLYAVTSGSKRTVEMVRMLLDAGADPDPPAYRGMSLVRWCARDPRLHDVKAVLEQAIAARDAG